MSTNDKQTPEQWAIVELFGHQRLAGRVSEHQLGGQNFIRVDVPAVKGRPPYTKLFGQGAIYAITFVDEAIATAAAQSIDARPVNSYDVASLKIDTVRQRLEHTNRDVLGEDHG